MSRLTDKFSLMRNMSEDELKVYIRTLTDNDKETLIFAFMKMFKSEIDTMSEFDRIEEW